MICKEDALTWNNVSYLVKTVVKCYKEKKTLAATYKYVNKICPESNKRDVMLIWEAIEEFNK